MEFCRPAEVDWPAWLAAVGTVGAFIAVWWQLGEARRDRIDRDVAMVTYLRNTLLTTAALLKSFKEWPEAEVSPKAKRALDLKGIEQFQREFEAVRACDMPNFSGADAHHCGLMALREATAALQRLADSDPSGSRYLQKQREDLKMAARRMHESVLQLTKQRFPFTWRWRAPRQDQPPPSVVDPQTREVIETPD